MSEQSKIATLSTLALLLIMATNPDVTAQTSAPEIRKPGLTAS